MNYESLISTARLRQSTSIREIDIISETESDKARILFSAPFRRLQKKAQVFPLESNAAVRSRLTHTLEVATIGRQLSQKIAKIKGESLKDHAAFVNIVESACLLHDIGNPPFGHFGEAAISEWFKENSEPENSIFHLISKKLPNEYKDLTNFDGNAQGLRIITKLQGEDLFGLNLTCSAISAYIKYTHPEYLRNKDEKPFNKKPGFFSTEEERTKEIWKKLNIPENKRNPLTFIMEAADDIAYCLSDIEDGIEKEIIRLNDLIDHISSTIPGTSKPLWNEILEKAEANKNIIEKFVFIRTNLINKSVDLASSVYINNEDKILNGEFETSLLDENAPETSILESARKFVAQHVYSSQEAEIIELSGNSVITGILEKLSPLLKLEEEKFKKTLEKDKKYIKEHNLHIHSRLANLLPSQSIKSYEVETKQHPELEWIYRAHLIVDYISGMTDDFALDIFQKLSGIKTS